MLNVTPYTQNLQNKNISFGRIPANYDTARQVMNEVADKCPKSCTMLAMRWAKFLKNKNDKVYVDLGLENLRLKLKQINKKYYDIVERTREKYQNKSHPNHKAFLKQIQKAVNTSTTKKKKVANCGENSYLCVKGLLEKGIKSDRISINLWDLKTGKTVEGMDHAFAVINIKDGAKLNNMNTWGPDALIVDSWMRVIGRARDVMQHFINEFGIDTNKHVIVIQCQDKSTLKLTEFQLLLTKNAKKKYNEAYPKIHQIYKNLVKSGDINKDSKYEKELYEFLDNLKISLKNPIELRKDKIITTKVS